MNEKIPLSLASATGFESCRGDDGTTWKQNSEKTAKVAWKSWIWKCKTKNVEYSLLCWLNRRSV